LTRDRHKKLMVDPTTSESHHH